jgi:hypothetical protein
MLASLKLVEGQIKSSNEILHEVGNTLNSDS